MLRGTTSVCLHVTMLALSGTALCLYPISVTGDPVAPSSNQFIRIPAKLGGFFHYASTYAISVNWHSL